VNVGYCLTGRSSRRWAKFLDSWPVPGERGTVSERQGWPMVGGGVQNRSPLSRLMAAKHCDRCWERRWLKPYPADVVIIKRTFG
jgi:hypothetical protein